MAIKVLQLGKFHPFKGGVEKVMEAFASGLSQRGYSCDLLCASADDEVGETPLTLNSRLIKTYTLGKLASTMISPQMAVTLKRICHDYDIIHIHHPDPMATLALFHSGYKGKVVLHWHSDILKQRIALKFFMPLQKWLIDRADLILGTSPVYVEESKALKKVQHKVDYLPIGVHERVADEGLVEQIRQFYRGRKIVYALGRLVEYKGFEYLIEAASLLSDDYVVVIGGSGPLKGELQRLVKGYRLGHKVHVRGHIKAELDSAFYAAADVFCLSSILKTEAYAIVQVEAMSAGCPVVATEISGSGVPWVNKHGYSGLNVQPRSSRELARAIQEVCDDPMTHQRYRDNAKQRYRDMFTLSVMNDALVSCYDRVLGNV